MGGKRMETPNKKEHLPIGWSAKYDCLMSDTDWLEPDGIVGTLEWRSRHILFLCTCISCAHSGQTEVRCNKHRGIAQMKVINFEAIASLEFRFILNFEFRFISAQTNLPGLK